MSASASPPITTKEEFFQSIKDTRTSQLSIPTIQKVPFMLKGTNDHFRKHFVPRVVSIGPYHHHRNEDLKLGEKLKLKFAGEFMAGKEGEIMAVYDKILQDVDALRKFYNEKEVEKVIPSKEELAQVLFLDGCWVLHYIYCYVNDEIDEHMIRDHHVAFVHQDLFLLENQLPFRVLNLLINAKYGTTASSAAGNPYEKKVAMKMIEEFIKNKIGPRGCGSPDLTEKHSHLLDLLRKRLVGCTNQQKSKRGLIFKRSTFPNVSELTAAGIYLSTSETNSLIDVSFTSLLIKGVLKLPQITVDESTGPMFLNLIAYEMSPGFENNMEVTSYICFLDSLIDHPDDVKQLRADKILDNYLGSDQKVADLFNEIGTDLVPNDQIYREVKFDIKNRYIIEKLAMAQLYQTFYQTYFGTPWTFLASVWGLIAILLTAITSFFTIFPRQDECSGLCKKLIKSPHI